MKYPFQIPVTSWLKEGTEKNKTGVRAMIDLRTSCFIDVKLIIKLVFKSTAVAMDLLILRLFMSDKIQITLPDGAVREYPKGTSALDIARSISEGLARKVLAAEVNGQVWDAFRPIQDNARLKLLT